MLEYKILEHVAQFQPMDPAALQTALNELAHDGWRVISMTGPHHRATYLLLERQRPAADSSTKAPLTEK